MLDEAIKTLLVALLQLVAALVGIGALWVFKAGVAKLKLSMQAEQYEMVRGYVNDVIRYFDQADYLNIDNWEKKERALIQIAEFSQQHGLDITVDEIDQMIEAAVQTMKSEVLPGALEEGFDLDPIED
jgi:CRISPR/Cas system CMR-associated protein Cmr1 (group 7 of RAMP superfamily)